MPRMQGNNTTLLSLVFALWLLSILQNAEAVQHIVGGSAGWSIPVIVNVNYTTWSRRHSFRVGDILLFRYIQGIHTVDQVKRTDYETCNDAEPMSHYTDGNTLIFLSRTGAYYFICGIPGHCTGGQKVEIQVKKAKKTSLSPGATPGPSLPPKGLTPTPGTPVQSSAPNRAPRATAPPQGSLSSANSGPRKAELHAILPISLVMGWAMAATSR
eukprot:c18220_g1_i1 orf=348-986(+)